MMSMIKSKVVFLLLISLVACEMRKNATPPKKEEELVAFPYNPLSDKKLMYSLMDTALSTGNVQVYSRVAGYYILAGHEQDFFYCAFAMANKYHCALAYYHVFLILCVAESGYPDLTFKKMDKKSKDFALYNLLKSYELDPEFAKSTIKDIFGKNTPIPRSSTYLQKYDAD